MDNGGTFRTREMFAHFWKVHRSGLHVNADFFVEYHGKSCCDTRFSHVSSMLKEYCNDPRNPRIRTTSGLASAIETMQRKQNKSRVKEKNPMKKILSTQNPHGRRLERK